MTQEKSDHNIEILYNYLALFFFGTLSLILFLFFGINLINDKNLYFIPQVLIIGSYVCYFSVTVFFIMYYLSKISDLVRISYSKYRIYYWVLFAIIFVLLVLIFGYIMLGVEKVIEYTFATLLVACVGVFGWLGKKLYERKKH